MTALHKDPYENIYCQVVGRKHFLLRPSLEMACVGEESLPAARYVRTKDGLEIREDDPPEWVPFPTVDLRDGSRRVEGRVGAGAGAGAGAAAAVEGGEGGRGPVHQGTTLQVTLNEGDILYLPAFWYDPHPMPPPSPPIPTHSPPSPSSPPQSSPPPKPSTLPIANQPTNPTLPQVSPSFPILLTTRFLLRRQLLVSEWIFFLF